MIFDETFKSLTGNPPFPWQRALYDRFVEDRPDNIPASCNLPTGLGKTSVVAVWLVALANYPEKIPRRLVYVVNRRTVVDQTTEEVQNYRTHIQTDPALKDLKGILTGLCAIDLGADNHPLAISTLRGQFADNREWSADPSRPAVICGTVDMIGSRLLFSGYGVGFRSRPLHAGFLAQDCLLVHDEAHLEPAFQSLLTSIEVEQVRCNEFRRMRVMELSATSRSGATPFELTSEEQHPPHEQPDNLTEPVHYVWRRLLAKKSIQLVPCGNEKKELAKQILALALTFRDSKKAVIIFLRTVDDVEKIVEGLHKEKQQTQQLTGTMRGLEREELVRNDAVFARFMRKSDEEPSETVFLVCTSAGEVGVNISADHLICDLSPFDSMAQRFGRVNRFGNFSDSQIHVVHPIEFETGREYETRRSKTLGLLRELDGDGSPKALGMLDSARRVDAFTPTPTILSATDILFDAWALTTIRDKMPGRPPVDRYLHGISDWEPPRTQVAWREDVSRLSVSFIGDEMRPLDDNRDLDRLADLAVELLDDYPLKPHELLHDRSDRVFKHIATIAIRSPKKIAWLVESDGTVECVALEELANSGQKVRINNRTVVLPPDVGGLLIKNGKSSGFLSGDCAFDQEHRDCYDVADQWTDEHGQRRIRVLYVDTVPDGMRLSRIVDLPSTGEVDDAEPPRWYWYERIDAADNVASKSSQFPVTLKHHTGDVVHHAVKIVERLSISIELQAAIMLAAEFHDLGKRRTAWQRSIGNPNPVEWLAKSGHNMKPRDFGSLYRHEFGSLVDVLDNNQQSLEQLRKLPNDMQDVVLHLIAVHHGYGRPHFPVDRAFDHEPKGANVDQIASDVPRRFARLQRRYGRWGLAYLESILRAADYAASANPTKEVTT